MLSADTDSYGNCGYLEIQHTGQFKIVICCSWGGQNGTDSLENGRAVSCKVKLTFAIRPVIPPLGIFNKQKLIT